MNRSPWLGGHRAVTASAFLAAALVSTAAAQPSAPPPEHRDPLRRALDANRDFQLDADEIAAAPAAIKTLDTNGDGKLDREELRPPMGPPRREGEAPERPQRREGLRPEGGGAGDRPGPERFLQRAKEFDADGDGKLDEGELRSLAEAMSERMRAGRGAGGPGGAEGPPRDGGERPQRPRRPE